VDLYPFVRPLNQRPALLERHSRQSAALPPVRRMTCARPGRCAGAGPVPAPGCGHPRNGAPGGKGEGQAAASDTPVKTADAACTGRRRAAAATARRGLLHRNRPGAVAIICRNRIGTALRHGDAGAVWVTPDLDGTPRVVNDGHWCRWPIRPPCPVVLCGAKMSARGLPSSGPVPVASNHRCA